jgi:hypothetical protein
MEKFTSYQAYGKASVGEVLGPKLGGVKAVEANTLASVALINRGDHFEVVEMPAEAQWSAGFAVAVGDYDGDGKEDVFLSQNFFEVPGEVSRMDGGRSLWMKGDGKGRLKAVPGQESGIQVYGEGRGAALCDYDGDGRVDVVVAQNGAETKLYHNVRAKAGLRVKLVGPEGNPEGIGAQMRLVGEKGQGPMREVHGGSGYWSQDSAVQVLGQVEGCRDLEVRWPGGKVTRTAIPEGASEITVNMLGSSQGPR